MKKSKDFCLCVEKYKKNKMSFIDLPSYERKRIANKKVNEFRDGFKIL